MCVSVCLLHPCRAHTRTEHMCSGNSTHHHRASPPFRASSSFRAPHPEATSVPELHVPARAAPLHSPPRPGRPLRLPPPCAQIPPGRPCSSFPCLRALLHPPTAPWPRGSSSVTRGGDGRGRVSLRGRGGPAPQWPPLASAGRPRKAPQRWFPRGGREGPALCVCPGPVALVPGAGLASRGGHRALRPCPPPEGRLLPSRTARLRCSPSPRLTHS